MLPMAYTIINISVSGASTAYRVSMGTPYLDENLIRNMREMGKRTEYLPRPARTHNEVPGLWGICEPKIMANKEFPDKQMDRIKSLDTYINEGTPNKIQTPGM